MPSEFDLRPKPRTSEGGFDPKVSTSTIITQVLYSEGEAVQLCPIKRLKDRQGQIVAGGSEIKICRESACIARSELSQRRTALEDQSLVEETSSLKQIQRMILSDVEQRGVTSALRALIVADQVTFSDTTHDPPPTLR